MIFSASILNHRAALFPYFAIIIWFGTTRLKPLASLLVILLSLTSSLTYFAARYPLHETMNNQYREFLRSQEKIADHSTVLPLILSPHIQFDSSGRSIASYFKMIEVFKHVSAHLSLEKDIVEFTFDPANQPHFPIHFRRHKNPYRLIGEIESIPPRVDFLRFAKAGQDVMVDYVIIWGLYFAHFKGRQIDHVKQQLQSSYDLIYSSQGNGYLFLFRRKGFESS